MGLMEKAREISEKAHAGQVRKTDGSDYVLHPIAVSEIVKDYGFDDITIAAALVHDVLEDTEITESELRTQLGDEVVDIVIAVSEDKNLEWEARKEKYIEEVASSDEKTKAVSVADKIHNAKSLISYYKENGSSTWERFNRGRDKKLWFERSLSNALQASWSHRILEEYDSLVTELENLD